MNQCRPCGCKGKRSCLICEEVYNIKPITSCSNFKTDRSFVYCYLCGKGWSGWNAAVEKDCPNHVGASIHVSGIYVLPNFITEADKTILLQGMNNEPWDFSQSGRRKQNYGPKCNFKKRKIQVGHFKGFPNYSKFLQEKFEALPILKNYQTIEQCSLEYNPQRGASIDPHIDDCWVWGERIVTVNVLGETYLSLTKFAGSKDKYNLNDVQSYGRILDEDGNYLHESNREPFHIKEYNEDLEQSDVLLRVFMPEKSLIVLYGSARYEWEHFVLREDIKNLRICLAFREFTPPYLFGEKFQSIGSDILKVSKNFF